MMTEAAHYCCQWLRFSLLLWPLESIREQLDLLLRNIHHKTYAVYITKLHCTGMHT